MEANHLAADLQIRAPALARRSARSRFRSSSLERGTPIPQHREREGMVEQSYGCFESPARSLHRVEASGREFEAWRRTRWLRIWKSAHRRWRGDRNALDFAAVLWSAELRFRSMANAGRGGVICRVFES